MGVLGAPIHTPIFVGRVGLLLYLNVLDIVVITIFGAIIIVGRIRRRGRRSSEYARHWRQRFRPGARGNGPLWPCAGCMGP